MLHPSSNTIRQAPLSSSEISMLDMLAGSLLSCQELPEQLSTICSLLQNHGFARIRVVTKHGQNSFQAWDITDEGQTYLIKRYKRELNK